MSRDVHSSNLPTDSPDGDLSAQDADRAKPHSGRMMRLVNNILAGHRASKRLAQSCQGDQVEWALRMMS